VLYNGVAQDPLDGVSMAYTFDSAGAEGQKSTQYFEILGSRGVYQDGWFACAFGPRRPWVAGTGDLVNWNPDEDVWELYNLKDDFSQAHDLAEKMPKKLQAMKDLFTMEATRNKVLPVGGAFYMTLHPEQMRASTLNGPSSRGKNASPNRWRPNFSAGFPRWQRLRRRFPRTPKGCSSVWGASPPASRSSWTKAPCTPNTTP
jgi:hypothetical protein